MDELKRGGFVFYYSYFEAMEEMTEDIRGHFINALVKYAFFDEMPEFEDVSERVAFKLIKATLDSSNNRYAACVENGKKGGAPKGNTNAKKKTTRETTRVQAKNNQRNNQTFNQTNNLKTTLMKNNMNMSMNTNTNLCQALIYQVCLCRNCHLWVADCPHKAKPLRFWDMELT